MSQLNRAFTKMHRHHVLFVHLTFNKLFSIIIKKAATQICICIAAQKKTNREIVVIL